MFKEYNLKYITKNKINKVYVKKIFCKYSILKVKKLNLT